MLKYTLITSFLTHLNFKIKYMMVTIDGNLLVNLISKLLYRFTKNRMCDFLELPNFFLTAFIESLYQKEKVLNFKHCSTTFP